jgi:hypothetical protein
MEIIKTLEKRYTFKGTGVPEYYLGGNIDEIDWKGAPDRKTFAWSAKTYISNITDRNIEKLYGQKLKNYQSPMDQTYRPELDESELPGEVEHNQYQMLVRYGKWVVTLGQYDVYYAVSTMVRYNAAPRVRQVTAMMRILVTSNTTRSIKLLLTPLPVSVVLNATEFAGEASFPLLDRWSVAGEKLLATLLGVKNESTNVVWMRTLLVRLCEC